MTTAAGAAAQTEAGANGVDAEELEKDAAARRQGWRPKDEFRGAAHLWVDRDTFMARTLAEAPLLRERLRFQDDMLRKSHNEVGQLRQLINEQGEYIKENISEMVNRGRRAEAGAFERQRAALKGRMRAAAASQDTAAYDAAEAELDALEQHRPAAPSTETEETERRPATREEKITQAPNPEAIKAALSPVVRAWMAKNTWFETSEKLSNFAVSVFREAINSGMAEQDALDHTEAEVRRVFPENFQNDRREAPSTVATTTREANSARTKPRGKTIDDLDENAKAALIKLKRLIPGYTDTQYLRDYKWPE